MRNISEDFNTNSSARNVDCDVIIDELQMSVQGEIGIIPEDKELFIRECEGFELVIDLDNLSLGCIRNAIIDAYEEFRFDDGESFKSMFMEDNDSFSEEEVDELIEKLGEDLESLMYEVSVDTYKTAV